LHCHWQYAVRMNALAEPRTPNTLPAAMRHFTPDVVRDRVAGTKRADGVRPQRRWRRTGRPPGTHPRFIPSLQSVVVFLKPKERKASVNEVRPTSPPGPTAPRPQRDSLARGRRAIPETPATRCLLRFKPLQREVP